MTKPIVTLRNVTVGYGRRPAVHHLDGALHAGDLLAVAGPNGAGKTTLIKALAGALTPIEGSIERDGLRRRDIAYLPQLAELDRTFPLDVRGLVTMGLFGRSGAFGRNSFASRDFVEAAIAKVGLDSLTDRPIGALSGGQAQRAMFARVIVQDARLILLDEPLNAVDARTAETLLDLAAAWSAEGRAVVAVLHDHERIRARFPHALLMARELIAWGPTGKTLTVENLFRARQMAEGWNDSAERCDRPAA